MKFSFPLVQSQNGVSEGDWNNWTWQLRHSLKSQSDFARFFALTIDEQKAFAQAESNFQIRCTPYYASLADPQLPEDPIRKILMPHALELTSGSQQMLDPLGEKRHNPAPRIIHRYPDRALFLVTDTCSVYCRYCTRKHFTGSEQAMIKASEYDEALSYLQSKKGIREVILSGGDPLTLSDHQLERVLTDLRRLEHIEIIRLGTRMPVVCPMRVTAELVQMLRRFNPVYMMLHFNHPRELTQQSVAAITQLADHGIPLMNQLVLLNGVNNHPAILQALCRRLLYLRVKPYYMFQCDPSLGTDHLRTSVEDSLEIQRELWGHLSGLAMPNLSLDIPNGGGKVGYVPQFQVSHQDRVRRFVGWDGVEAEYIDPLPHEIRKPLDAEDYFAEWEQLKTAKD